MEELTKQQIVLVTLLVSFVTSIATGIVTVALMDQAPPGVTQTINRVVERTIEKVVPSTNQTAAVITKETVVIKEDDLVVEAVNKNQKSLVSIIKIPDQGDAKSGIFAGNGLIVSKDGLIATDATIIENQNLIPQNLKAIFPDGTILPFTVVYSDSATGIIFLKPILDDKTSKTVFVLANIADAGSLKLGQTVIALGGDKVSVATGIVSNISYNKASGSQDATATSTDTSASSSRVIKTDVFAPDEALGSVLVNLSGDVVGIRALSAGSANNLFLSANLVIKAMGKITVPSVSSQAR
ncbi:MAG: serine protease [bacterium]|nr:serine protease [bacterium]